MGGVDDVEDKSSKTGQIVLSLLRVLLEDAMKGDVQWLGKSWNMDKSQKLQPVEPDVLVHEKLWNCRGNIKNEVPGQVVVTNGGQLFVCSRLLDKVEEDLHKENDINSKLDFDESLLVRLFSLAHLSILVTVHVDLLESEDEWGHKESVDNEKGNHEVPHLTESPLRVNKVPLKLWLTIDYLILFISIFVDVIDHHFL